MMWQVCCYFVFCLLASPNLLYNSIALRQYCKTCYVMQITKARPTRSYVMVGPHSRFHGECRGHHNCNFKLVQGQIITFGGQCIMPGIIPQPPPAPAPPHPAKNHTSLTFAKAMGSHMVLQQSPAMAAVYGVIGSTHSSSHPPRVTVTVTPSPSRKSLDQAHHPTFAPKYTVDATITGATWKALLHPTKAGGNYSVTATCTAGCEGSSTIVDETFGDVYYCAGQSNMALPLLHTFHRNISRDR